MMHKRTLHSLLIVSFIVVFAAASYGADEVVISDASAYRCVDGSVNVTANIDAPVTGIEVVLDLSSTVDCGNATINGITWALDMGVLPDRGVDLSMLPMVRFWALSTGMDPAPMTTSGVIATIDFTTADCCEGEAEFAGAIWPSAPPFGVVQTQFVDAATSALRFPAVLPGTISITNQAPVLTDAPSGDYTILHGDTFDYALAATDADEASCENLTFFIVSGPAAMTVSPSGNLEWVTTGDDVCMFDGDIVVGVRDKCGAESISDPFTICVTNTPPYFTATADLENEIAWGMTFSFDFDGMDDDPGPYGPFFHVVDWAYGVPAPTIDPNTGALEWATDYEPEYTGTFEVCVRIDDGANVCDPCAPVNDEIFCFNITVVPFQLTISKEEDVILGQERTVNITMLDNTYVNKEIGGFDFLIQYDNSAMTFLYASEGDFITDCEWEYFTYRFGPNGNCGPSACPSGVLRVVAMGETTGGNLAHHPACWTNGPGISNELVKLHFRVSADANLECNYAPIRFVWYDCGDNGVSSRVGDFLFISDLVYDFAGFDEFGGSIFNEITGLDMTFPTMTGAPSPECDVETEKGHPWRLVHFYNGGLDLICADSIDAVGDINLNGLAYEIADAVMFTNYFIEGLSALIYNPTYGYAGSIAASDTNKDGITLSVADLVYLIRVVVGDAQPYAKEINVATVNGSYTNDNGAISMDAQVGGVHLVVDGLVTPNSNLNMDYRHVDGTTRIIVTAPYEAGSNVMNAFTGEFVNGIDGEIISIEAADVAGNPIALKNIPANYELSQNYPNPFNPGTKIDFSMPAAGSYEIVIYNVAGQVVQVHNGSADAGYHTYEWDASELASGVYLYRFTTDNFSSVKKAILLK